MTNIPPDITAEQLAALVRANAKGVYGTEAATELLISHDIWLHDPAFLENCVWFQEEDPTRTVSVSRWAGIEWPAVPGQADRALQSRSAVQILQICAELAGTDTGEPFGHLLTGLDERNSQLVLDAIAHVLRRGGVVVVREIVARWHQQRAVCQECGDRFSGRVCPNCGDHADARPVEMLALVVKRKGQYRLAKVEALGGRPVGDSQPVSAATYHKLQSSYLAQRMGTES